MRIPDLLKELEATVGPECERWTFELSKRAKFARDAGDTTGAEWFDLVNSACQPRLSARQSGGPYRTWFSLGDRRSVLPEDFDDECLESLARTIGDGCPPDYRARIGDLRWLGPKRDAMSATEAVSAYLDTARALGEHDDRGTVSAAANRFLRAAQIARQLGTTCKSAEAVEDFLEDLLTTHPPGSEPFLPAHVLDAYQILGRGDPEYLAAAGLAHAVANEKASKFDWARRSYEHAVYFFTKAGDKDKAHAAQLAWAESYVLERKFMEQAGAIPLLLVDLDRRAIAAFRKIGGMRTRVDQIQEQLQETQVKATASLKPMSVEFDIAEAQRRARERYEALPPEKKLLGVGAMGLNYLKSAARPGLPTEASVADLLPKMLVNSEGHTVATVPGLSPSGANDAKAAESKRVEAWVLNAGISSQMFLEPLSPLLWRDLIVDPAKLDEFLEKNEFVPPSRADIFARGIKACLDDRLVDGLSLLLPQLENAIRFVLQQHGVEVVRINSDKSLTQEYYPLETLLAQKQTTGIFGEELVLGLKALLTHDVGLRLRHRNAHGLMNSPEYDRMSSGLVLWMTVTMCALGYQSARRAVPAESSRGSKPTPPDPQTSS